MKLFFLCNSKDGEIFIKIGAEGKKFSKLNLVK